VSGSPPALASPPRERLGRVLARGMMWVGLFRWSAQLLSWGATLAVLRILTPADYGIVGMTTYFVGLASVLSEFGIGSAVIAARELTLPMKRQLNLFALGLGLAGSLAALAAAAPLSRYFAEPALVLVMPVLGTVFVIDSLRAVPQAVLSRDLAYRQAASADFVRAVTSALIVLLLAVLGAGYWSLVAGIVGGSLAASVWVLARHPIGWVRPRWAELRGMLRYCRHILVGRLAWQGYQNADFVVAGKMLGVDALGSYNVAWTIASLPGDKLITIVNAATSPFFASLQTKPDILRHYFLRVTGLLCLALFPLLFGFLLVADLAIPVVLGQQWQGAIAPARALVFYAALQSISALIATLLIAIGRADVSMRNSLLCLLLLPPGFVLGGRLGGSVGIALVWACSYPLVIAMPLRAALRFLDIRLRTYLTCFRLALSVVAAMTVAVLGFRLLAGRSLSAEVELVVAILIGAAATGVTLLVAAPDELRALRGLIRPSPAEADPPISPADVRSQPPEKLA
jgi:polysaccharide transporter, PST family